jgi:TusA-related sulfurtransferase
MNDTKTRKIDLRGEVCPYTFVKSKLVMEEMDVGEVLEVIVDYPPAVKNIPKSMEMEGQQLVEVQKLDTKEWKVVLQKQKP